QHLDRDRSAVPGHAEVYHAHAARAQPRGQPVVPDPCRVIGPKRRARQRGSPLGNQGGVQAGQQPTVRLLFPTVSAWSGGGQPAGRRRTTNCWLAWVWTLSMPVTE